MWAMIPMLRVRWSETFFAICVVATLLTSSVSSAVGRPRRRRARLTSS
jgi:hypothetical protein